MIIPEVPLITFTVTFAVSIPPLSSVTLYSKVLIPINPSSGVYSITPSEKVTDPFEG